MQKGYRIYIEGFFICDHDPVRCELSDVDALFSDGLDLMQVYHTQPGYQDDVFRGIFPV